MLFSSLQAPMAITTCSVSSSSAVAKREAKRQENQTDTNPYCNYETFTPSFKIHTTTINAKAMKLLWAVSKRPKQLTTQHSTVKHSVLSTKYSIPSFLYTQQGGGLPYSNILEWREVQKGFRMSDPNQFRIGN